MHIMTKLQSWDCTLPVVWVAPIFSFSDHVPRRVQVNLSERRLRLAARGQDGKFCLHIACGRSLLHLRCGSRERNHQVLTGRGTITVQRTYDFINASQLDDRLSRTGERTEDCLHHPRNLAENGKGCWYSRLARLVAQLLPLRKEETSLSLLPATVEGRPDGNEALKQFIRHVAFAFVAAMVGFCGHWNPRTPFRAPAIAATAEILIKRAPADPKARKPTVKQRAIYALDYFFATEPAGKAVILLAITAIMTTIGGVLYYRAAVSDDPDAELPESVWAAWTFVADPGTHAGENTVRRRLVAVPLTMGGMLFFALLVGLMSDAVSSKVDQLQKGGTPVIEENHTLIVGWTTKTIPLVKELTEANKSRGPKRSIVVLGHEEKEQMDEELLQALPVVERSGSKVVTRRGRPTASEDLKLCSASMARAIIVLSPDGLQPLEADAQVLQTCLVLCYLSEMRGDIVAELAQLDSVKLMKDMLSTALTCAAETSRTGGPSSIVSTTSGPESARTTERLRKLVPVATEDIVLRMMVDRAFQPGTAAVAKELLLFEGSEFRFKPWPELVGKRFEEIMFLFEDAIPCGLRKESGNGQRGKFTLVNPPPNTIIEEGDKVLVISEDDDSYQPDVSHEPSEKLVPTALQKPNKPVLKIFISGWRHDLKDVLRHVDSSVSRGSEVTILAEANMEVRNKELKSGSPLQNIKLVHKFGDPQSRQVLEELPLETYDKTIILGNNNKKELGFNTSITALLVRHIQVQRGRRNSVIVAEQAAAQDDALQRVQDTWMINTIVPEELQAMVLAHLAEDADVGAVLDEVVSDSGSNMLLHEVGAYADYGEGLSFWELQSRALQNGEIVIAHKCTANGGEWVLNPPNKSEKLIWNKGDELLVLTRPAR